MREGRKKKPFNHVKKRGQVNCDYEEGKRGWRSITIWGVGGERVLFFRFFWRFTLWDVLCYRLFSGVRR